jgi:hypothetical protein
MAKQIENNETDSKAGENIAFTDLGLDTFAAVD